MAWGDHTHEPQHISGSNVEASNSGLKASTIKVDACYKPRQGQHQEVLQFKRVCRAARPQRNLCTDSSSIQPCHHYCECRGCSTYMQPFLYIVGLSKQLSNVIMQHLCPVKQPPEHMSIVNSPKASVAGTKAEKLNHNVHSRVGSSKHTVNILAWGKISQPTLLQQQAHAWMGTRACSNTCGLQ